MKSGFVEMVMKVARRERMALTVPGHVKTSILNSFKEFTENILPQMEKRIEIQLLKETLRTTSSKLIRDELINAYLRRLNRLTLYQIQEPLNIKKQIIPPVEGKLDIPDPTITKPLNQHSAYDIGYYCEFLEQDMNTVFKHQCFGTYKDMEYYGTNKFSVMIRQESISITNALKRIQNAQPVDWDALKKMSSHDLKEYINDEENYMHVFNAISNSLYEEAKKHRSHEHFVRIWGSSVLSDIIVNSIIRDLHTIPNPLEYAKKCVKAVMKLKHPPSPGDIHELKYIYPENRLQLRNQVPKNASFFWKTPSFKSVFLGGQGGTGKSMIITYVSMWAHKNGWVVLNLPNAYKLNNDKNVTYRRAYNGLFVTQDYARKWLQQFRSANLDFVRKTKVNKDLYGKIDYTGVHDEEYNPVPNLYDPRRETYFNDVDSLGPQHDIADQGLQKQTRMSNFVPNPQTLDEICIAGIKDQKLATSAIGELLQQLYDLDVPILSCVDAFNWFYRPSSFKSFRYYNDRKLYGRVPPSHIAISRLFMHLDGHRIKKGLKIVTSSTYPLHNHKFSIQKIKLPKNYQHHVRVMNQAEFGNAAKFNMRTGWWPAPVLLRQYPNYMYMLCQGNWQDFQKTIFTNYYL